VEEKSTHYYRKIKNLNEKVKAKEVKKKKKKKKKK